MDSPYLQLVYLDQCAACELANAKPPWDRIRRTLETKVEGGRALCPLPYETQFESAPCDESLRIALADFFEKVSGGWKIKHFDELIVEETVSLVRHQPVFFLSQYQNLIPLGSRQAEFTKRVYHGAKTEMEARALAFEYQPEQLGQNIQDIQRSTNEGRARMIYSDIQELMKGTKRGLRVLGTETELVRINYSQQELEDLLEHVLHHRWETIPLNYVEMLIGAQWEFLMTRKTPEPKKYKFNDEIDRWRAAVAITYCDMLITDSGAASLATTAIQELRSAFPCKIFSVRQVDEIEIAIEAL